MAMTKKMIRETMLFMLMCGLSEEDVKEQMLEQGVKSATIEKMFVELGVNK